MPELKLLEVQEVRVWRGRFEKSSDLFVAEQN